MQQELVTDAATARRMSLQRRRDTDAEMLLRRALHERGHRYRVNAPIEGMARRRADVTFTKRRVVVFVDGCFWHGCPDHGTAPRRNAMWWEQKLRRNVERDRETDQHLTERGWRVVRIWEHEDLLSAVTKVEAALGGKFSDQQPLEGKFDTKGPIHH